jgi:hypothetical protein
MLAAWSVEGRLVVFPVWDWLRAPGVRHWPLGTFSSPRRWTAMLLEREGIKSEVSQRDWAQREWTTLRRVKLESLLEKMHESKSSA